LGADAAGIDEATDANFVSNFKFRDFRADGRDDAGDLMAGHHRILGAAPFVARLMDVRVADAAEFDLDGNVEFARLAAIESEGSDGRFGAGCGVGFGGAHAWSFPNAVLS